MRLSQLIRTQYHNYFRFSFKLRAKLCYPMKSKSAITIFNLSSNVNLLFLVGISSASRSNDLAKHRESSRLSASHSSTDPCFSTNRIPPASPFHLSSRNSRGLFSIPETYSARRRIEPWRNRDRLAKPGKDSGLLKNGGIKAGKRRPEGLRVVRTIRFGVRGKRKATCNFISTGTEFYGPGNSIRLRAFAKWNSSRLILRIPLRREGWKKTAGLIDRFAKSRGCNSAAEIPPQSAFFLCNVSFAR